MDELDRIKAKILQDGKQSLTELEKLAYALGKLNNNRSTLNIAQKLLTQFKDLKNLQKATYQELTKIPDLGIREIEIILATTHLLIDE